MAQEQSDTRKILQELAALKRKINEIEVSVARRNNNVLRETFGTAKFKKSTEQMMKETNKEVKETKIIHK